MQALVGCGADTEAAARWIAERPDLLTMRTEHTQETALHWLAIEGAHHAVEALARAGADVNALDSSGATPLMSAVYLGQPHMVRVLLRLGANPNGCSPGTGTVLHHWARSPDPEVLQLLLAAGTEVDAVDDMGETALFALVSRSGTLLRMQDPAMAAKVAPFLESMNLPLEMPADRPEDLAEAVCALVAAGADVEREAFGCTPLTEAAEAGDLAMVRTLLEAGADPSRRDAEGATAADRAESAGHTEIAALLRWGRPR